VDGDGLEDLILGSGKGGRLSVFRTAAKAISSRWIPALCARPSRATKPASSAGAIRPGRSSFSPGSANYEDGLASGPCVRQFNLSTGTVDDSFPSAEASAGPLAMADVDADGDLDLFVGGRVLPGRYPIAASSQLFRNDGGRFVRDAESSRVLEHVGLVSGAVFSDLDGDGLPELILACEWGPLRILQNDKGRLRPRNPPVRPPVPPAPTPDPQPSNSSRGWWTASLRVTSMEMAFPTSSPAIGDSTRSTGPVRTGHGCCITET